MGYTLGINKPYNGSVVPKAFYRKDSRVMSIMVEVNRNLYMDEVAGTKKDTFRSIKKKIRTLLRSLRKFQHGAPPDRKSDALHRDR